MGALPGAHRNEMFLKPAKVSEKLDTGRQMGYASAESA